MPDRGKIRSGSKPQFRSELNGAVSFAGLTDQRCEPIDSVIATVGLDRQQAYQIEGVGVCRIDRERVSAADMRN
jgi:hypothetical protein